MWAVKNPPEAALGASGRGEERRRRRAGTGRGGARGGVQSGRGRNPTPSTWAPGTAQDARRHGERHVCIGILHGAGLSGHQSSHSPSHCTSIRKASCGRRAARSSWAADGRRSRLAALRRHKSQFGMQIRSSGDRTDRQIAYRRISPPTGLDPFTGLVVSRLADGMGACVGLDPDVSDRNIGETGARAVTVRVQVALEKVVLGYASVQFLIQVFD